MLIDFLYELRKRKLKVSTHEWRALMEATESKGEVYSEQMLKAAAGGLGAAP